MKSLIMNKTLHAILSILDKHPTVVGSRELSRDLTLRGVEITERMVRYRSLSHALDHARPGVPGDSRFVIRGVTVCAV